METENKKMLLSISVGYDKLTREVDKNKVDALFHILCQTLNTEILRMGIAENPSRLYPVDETESVYLTEQIDNIEVSDFEQNDVKPTMVTVGSSRASISSDSPHPASEQRMDNARLCFVRCPDCGRLNVGILNDDGLFIRECPTCGYELNYSKEQLYRGNYTCECGADCNFYMTDDISVLKCKTCNTKHAMLYDPDTNTYNGYDIPTSYDREEERSNED